MINGYRQLVAAVVVQCLRDLRRPEFSQEAQEFLMSAEAAELCFWCDLPLRMPAAGLPAVLRLEVSHRKKKAPSASPLTALHTEIRKEEV